MARTSPIEAALAARRRPPGAGAPARLDARVPRRRRCSAALLVLLLLGGVIVSLVDGALAGAPAFRLRLRHRRVWNPVTEEFGALRADLRHPGHLADRDG